MYAVDAPGMFNGSAPREFHGSSLTTRPRNLPVRTVGSTEYLLYSLPPYIAQHVLRIRGIYNPSIQWSLRCLEHLNAVLMLSMLLHG
jgi:hypothetical protein